MNMANMVAGNPITASSINNDFITQVKDVILSGAYHADNIPYELDETYHINRPMIQPVEVLGTLNSIPDPSVGVTGGAITAAGIYNNLVWLTQVLTRVGTWSYTRTYTTTYFTTNNTMTGETTTSTAYPYPNNSTSLPSGVTVTSERRKVTMRTGSGKALFTDAYARSLPGVNTGEVTTNNPISVTSLNSLLSYLLQAWRNASKYHHVTNLDICHSDCYSNCYSSCYGQANCYK